MPKHNPKPIGYALQQEFGKLCGIERSPTSQAVQLRGEDKETLYGMIGEGVR